MKNKNPKAFTLVELIVVIIILAILGTIAFISLQGYSSSARNSRRILDINNIKTSLELFILNSGVYPIPDNYEIVSYGGDDLRYQGVIGEQVTTNLSKNLNKKPTDPLYEIEYIYSITNTKKEYELLSFYEGTLTYSPHPNPLPMVEGTKPGFITQANAATNVTAKIIGNYNQLYVKSANYIVPTPSIINAEVNGTGMILNENNIKSQILSEGENIPNVNIGGIDTQTGKLEILLSVYTGSITKESTSTGKILAIEKIQQAYSGTTLSNNGIYKYILGKTSDEEKLGLAETVLLNNNFKFTTDDDGGVELVLVNGQCGTDSGQVLIAEPINKCTTGTSTGLTDGGVGGLYEWYCEGENGGINDSCSASHISCTNITSSIKNYWKFNDISPSDNFTGTSFSSKWTIQDNGGTSIINNNQYQGTVIGRNAYSIARILNNQQLVGDFEVQIDAGITTKSNNTNMLYGELILNIGSQYISYIRAYVDGYYNSGIGIWSGTNRDFGLNSVRRVSSVNYPILTNIPISTKLKTKRVGNTITNFGWDGSSWQTIGLRSNWGTGDVSLALAGPEVVGTYPNNSVTWIDNLIVNSGEKLIDTKNLNNGSIQNLANWITGKIGNALSFNGTNNYVNLGTTGIANPKVNTSGSISFWAKTTAGAGIIYSEQEATPYGTLFIGKNSFSIHTGTTFVTVTNPATINNGTWYHYVATWSPTQMSLYVNGVGASTPYSGTTQTFSKPMIGAYYSGGALAGYFNGSVDDFSIYNRVLTQAEITKIYNDGNAGGTVCGY